MKLEEHQVAVVTGAASGIGFGIAEEFARRGIDVVMIDVEEGALADAAEKIRRHGHGVLVVEADVRHYGPVEAAAKQAISAFGRIDIVCNNAGVNTSNAPAWELEENDWRWVLEVNLWGVIHGIRAFVPYLVSQDHGHVVNTASMAGLRPIPGLAPYVVSKHAVIALTECLRADLDANAPHVGTTALCPWWVWSKVREAERNRPEELKRTSGTTLPPRPPQSLSQGQFRTPEEVALQVVGAIEENRPYLLTHSAGAGLEDAKAHLNRLLAFLDG